MKSLFLVPFLFSATAFAQVNADSSDSILDALSKEIQSGRTVGIVAAAILMLVFLFRKYLQPKIGLGNGSLPWIAIALGVLVAVAGDILNGLSPGEAAKVALLSGPAAMTTWAAILKLVTKK